MKKTTLTQKFIAPSLIMSSFVVAASVPIASVNAMTAGASTTGLTGSLTSLQQQLTSAIDTNLSKLTQSQSALNASFSLSPTSITGSANGPAGGSLNYTVNKDSANGQITTANGGTASYNVSPSGANAQVSSGNGDSKASSAITSSITSALSLGQGLFTDILSLPTTLVAKLQAVNQKAIDKLTTLKTQVDTAAKSGDAATIQIAVKQFNQNEQDFAIAHVQASVSKAIDSQAKVLDQLQNVANNLQTQISKIKDCAQNGSADASASASSKSASATVTCGDLNVAVNSGDAAASLQQKLDQVKANIQTIRSFLSSSINLVSSLSANSSGTVSAFQGIASQLDIVANMSASIQNDLLNLSASVSKQ